MRRGVAVTLSGVALVASCVVAAPLASWEVEHEQKIAATPATVWQVLTDLARYPEWNPYSRRVEGTLRVGERVRVEAHLGGETRFVENRVTRLEAPRTLCWESQGWYAQLARGTRCRNLETLPDGSTRLVHHEVMDGPLAWLIERLYRPRIEAGLRDEDGALAAAAEAAEREGSQ